MVWDTFWAIFPSNSSGHTGQSAVQCSALRGQPRVCSENFSPSLCCTSSTYSAAPCYYLCFYFVRYQPARACVFSKSAAKSYVCQFDRV
jgi:hypothetical protein